MIKIYLNTFYLFICLFFAASPEIQTENRIIFPDDDTSLELDSRSNMDLCGNDVICENVPNYPIDIIEQQLEEKQHLMHFQTEDAVS